LDKKQSVAELLSPDVVDMIVVEELEKYIVERKQAISNISAGKNVPLFSWDPIVEKRECENDIAAIKRILEALKIQNNPT